MTSRNLKENNIPMLIYSDHSIKFNTMGDKDSFSFQGDFAKCLDIEENASFTNFSKIEIQKYKEDFFIISTLYVYSDITVPVFVGDKSARLLRTVHVNNNSNSSQCVIYDVPHYVPLEVLQFPTIKIEIKDEKGEYIKFKRGKVIIKLHFRPIRNF